MIKIHILFCVLLSCISVSFAQEGHKTLSGKVFDEQGNPVPYGSLLLYSIDSSFYNGQYFEDGDFSINTIQAENLQLRISAIGYQDTLVVIPKVNRDIDLGTFQLYPTTLEAVEVTAVKERITVEDDVTTISVANSWLSSSVNTSDLLSRLPGVLKIGDDLQVVGKGTPIILYKKQEITTDQLTLIPPEMIKEIKIDRSPSAQYSAQGRVVLHIIPKESYGYNGFVTQTATKGKWWKSHTTAGVNWTKNKLSSATALGASTGTYWADWRNAVVYTAPGNGREIQNVNNANTPFKMFNGSQRLRFSLNEKQELSLEYNAQQMLTESESWSQSQLLQYGQVLGQSTASGLAKFGALKHQLNGNYILKLDTLGSTLFIGIQGVENTNTSEQESMHDEHPQFRIRQQEQNQTHLLSGQVDFTKSFSNQVQFKAGGRFSNAGLNAENEQKEAALGEAWVLREGIINQVNYEEQVTAGYTEIRFPLGKNSASFGIRAEHTQFKLNSNTQVAQQPFSKDSAYFSVFPQASYTAAHNNWSYNLTFNSKINRPVYGMLSPYRLYYDSLNYNLGNPKLMPEYTYEGSLGLTWKNQYTWDFSYLMTDEVHMMNVKPEHDSSAVSVYFWDNLNQKQTWSSGLTIPWNTKKITTFTLFRFNLNKVSDADAAAQRIIPEWYAFTNADVLVTKNVHFILTYLLNTQSQNGIQYNGRMQSLNVGTTVSLFQNKWQATLMFNDMFRTYLVDQEMFLNNLRYASGGYFDTRNVQLTIKYNFGQLKAGIQQQKTVGQEELDRL